MISAADVPVESGQGYTITGVDGHQPESLSDFVGDVQLTLTRNGQLLHVTGAGAPPTSGSVRFYQKDLALHGRDIGVWTMTRPATPHSRQPPTQPSDPPGNDSAEMGSRAEREPT
jgi:hypothetical protein